MTRNAHMIAITLSKVFLAILILVAILVASALLNAGPIVDMRL